MFGRNFPLPVLCVILEPAVWLRKQLIKIGQLLGIRRVLCQENIMLDMFLWEFITKLKRKSLFAGCENIIKCIANDRESNNSQDKIRFLGEIVIQSGFFAVYN